jgi:hypothetical protein
MIRVFRRLAGLGLAALLPLAALSVAADSPGEDHQRCSMEGRVTDAAGGTPVEGALVTARGTGDVSAKTDSNGRYVLKDLRAGVCRVYAGKEGYGGGPGGIGPPLKTVRLAAGQQVRGIDLQMRKESVLAGRVLDADMNPVVGARVYLWGRSFKSGSPDFQNRASARTNDLGEYRFSGLTEDPWYLGSLNPTLQFHARPPRATTEPRGKPTSAHMFYPNALSIADAEPIRLRGGEERLGVDLVLPRVDTFCVAVSVAAGTGTGRIFLNLLEHSSGWYDPVALGGTPGLHEFETCGIPRGSYYLEAGVANENNVTTGYARAFFEVMDRDVDLGQLYLASGVKVPGKVTVADAKPKDAFPAGIRVELADQVRRFIIASAASETQVQAPGDFVIPNAFADEYWLRCRLPSGYYVKEAWAGARDLRRESFRAGSGELRIVLGLDGASVAGKVLDGDKPIGNATVVLTPAQLPPAGVPDLIRTQVSDQDGQFELANIAPGEYRLLAFAGLAMGESEDFDLLRRYLTKATDLTLGAREAKSVTLTVLNPR